MTDDLLLEARIKDGITSELRRMGGGLDRFERRAKTNFEGIKRSAERLRRAIGAPLRSSIVRLTGAFAAFAGLTRVTRDFQEFEKSLAEIGTISDSTTRGLQRLGDGLRGVARQFNISEIDAAGAAYQAISAGATDAAGSVDFLNTAARLSVGGLSTLREATDLLALSTNAYATAGLAAGDAADSFFTTVRLGRTTIPELASSISTVLPLASSLGVAFDDVGAAIATLTATGAAGSTAEAATQLRGIFAGLLRSVDDVDKVFRRVGERFDENTLRTRGLAFVLRTLQEATRGSSAELITLLGRVEGASAAIALGGAQFARFTDNIAEFENKAGAADAAFERISNTATFKVGRALNALRLEFTRLGERITNTAARVVEDLGGVDGVVGRFKPVIEALEILVGRVVERFGDITKGITSLIAFFGGAEIGAFLAGIEQTLAAVVTAVAKIVAFLASQIAELRQSIGDPLGVKELVGADGFAEEVREAGDAVEELFQRVRGNAQLGNSLFDALVGQANDESLSREVRQRARGLIQDLRVSLEEGRADLSQASQQLFGELLGVGGPLGAVSAGGTSETRALGSEIVRLLAAGVRDEKKVLEEELLALFSAISFVPDRASSEDLTRAGALGEELAVETSSRFLRVLQVQYGSLLQPLIDRARETLANGDFSRALANLVGGIVGDVRAAERAGRVTQAVRERIAALREAREEARISAQQNNALVESLKNVSDAFFDTVFALGDLANQYAEAQKRQEEFAAGLAGAMDASQGASFLIRNLSNEAKRGGEAFGLGINAAINDFVVFVGDDLALGARIAESAIQSVTQSFVTLIDNVATGAVKGREAVRQFGLQIARSLLATLATEAIQKVLGSLADIFNSDRDAEIKADSSLLIGATALGTGAQLLSSSSDKLQSAAGTLLLANAIGLGGNGGTTSQAEGGPVSGLLSARKQPLGLQHKPFVTPFAEGGEIVSGRRPQVFGGRVAVGEAGADELVIPLSRGREVQVDLSRSARGRMGATGMNSSGPAFNGDVNLTVQSLDPRTAAEVLLEPTTRRAVENMVADAIASGSNQALRQAVARG